jgi:hypothetical protein
MGLLRLIPYRQGATANEEPEPEDQQPGVDFQEGQTMTGLLRLRRS